jgi:uncharacterized OsmC-like protein
MPLNSFMKVRRTWSIATIFLVASALPGCISATAPILADAQAILGEQIEVHLFGSSKGGAPPHTVATFQWNGSRYLPRGRSQQDFGDFTIHPYEGRDLIIQTLTARAPQSTEFALARRLAERVYLIIPIHEDDADEATRERFCTKTQDASCRISTPEQLFVFARASAAKEDESSAIAVLVPSERR